MLRLYVLYLVDRQNGYIPGIRQASMPVQSLQAIEGTYISVRVHPDFINRIRSRT